jgi:hypothetical protein
MSYGPLVGFAPTPQETASSGHNHWPIMAPTGTIAALSFGFRPPSPSVGSQPILRSAVRISNKQSFAALAGQWSSETGAHSSLTVRQRHPAYQAIISMGWDAVPLLLKALQDTPDYWFPALSHITGENPVGPAIRGDYDKMTEVWLGWGRQRGVIN